MFKKISLAAVFLFIFVSYAYCLSFKSGFSERIRHEFRKNITDLENGTLDNRNYFKIKTSVWGQLDFNKDLDLYLKLTNENKPYMYWAGASATVGKSASKKGYRYEIDEVVFDNIYFDWKNFINFPLDLRLGRQDLDYGEGFLIKDGTPVDSTRTYYFNAIKATWHTFEKDDLDFIFIRNNKTDDVFPTVNKLSGGGQVLTSSNETAYALYNKNDSFKDLHLENYYIYKKEEGAGSSSSNRMTRAESSLNTVGSVVNYKMNPFDLRSQLSYQLGKYGEEDRTGLGGYFYLDKNFSSLNLSPKLTLGLIYISGDKRGTSKNEAWDPLFSRWPMLPDVFGLYFVSETETYYWSNFTAYNAGLVLTPNKKTKLACKYYFLRANEQVNPTAALFSGSGKTRGSLPEVRIDYSFNKNITACLVADYFIPGNFYVETADESVFLKTELQVKF